MSRQQSHCHLGKLKSSKSTHIDIVGPLLGTDGEVVYFIIGEEAAGRWRESVSVPVIFLPGPNVAPMLCWVRLHSQGIGTVAGGRAASHQTM